MLYAGQFGRREIVRFFYEEQHSLDKCMGGDVDAHMLIGTKRGGH